MVVGRPHALRELKAPPDTPLRKVVVLQPPRKGQVQVRHADGDLQGLTEWISTRIIVCLWSDRKAFLRDEREETALREYSDPARREVEERALSFVLTATGEEGGFSRTWTLDRDKAERLWARAGLKDPAEREPYSYVDRDGQLHVTYQTTMKFAKAFAAAEPEPCLLYIREWEERLRAEGYQPGNSYAHSLLREWEPGMALVRAWCSQPTSDLLEKELKRVRGIAMDAIDRLESAGHKQQARRLRAALDGR